MPRKDDMLIVDDTYGFFKYFYDGIKGKYVLEFTGGEYSALNNMNDRDDCGSYVEDEQEFGYKAKVVLPREFLYA